MFNIRTLLLLCLGSGITALLPSEIGLPLRLTPLIKSNKTEEARELSLVTELTPNITSYSGFITVDEECDSNMFFWFFPAKNNYTEKPVTLWLSGGPGTSSLFGLFVENGPYELTLNGELKLREFSWDDESSIIYLDNPVGTGFSFAKGVECYSTNQSHIAKNAITTLEQFFELFPELKQNKLFLAGESYAGKYIPAIGNAIKQNSTIKNLEGFAIGNGIIDPINQLNYSEYYYQLGLIDLQTKNEMAEIEKNIQEAIQNGNYTEALLLRNDKLLNETFAQRSGFKSFYNFLYPKGQKKANYGAFVDQDEVRKAIHVGNATWHGDAYEVSTLLMDDIMRSELEDFKAILDGYRGLIYYGQLDLRDPYAPSINIIQQLNWAEYEEAERSPWYVDGELAGYQKTVSNFTEILVRNAGHMVPYNQPKWAYNMFNTFIKGDFKPKNDLRRKNEDLIKDNVIKNLS